MQGTLLLKAGSSLPVAGSSAEVSFECDVTVDLRSNRHHAFSGSRFLFPRSLQRLFSLFMIPTRLVGHRVRTISSACGTLVHRKPFRPSSSTVILPYRNPQNQRSVCTRLSLIDVAVAVRSFARLFTFPYQRVLQLSPQSGPKQQQQQQPPGALGIIDLSASSTYNTKVHL